jgi:hypothetical protein
MPVNYAFDLGSGERRALPGDETHSSTISLPSTSTRSMGMVVGRGGGRRVKGKITTGSLPAGLEHNGTY